MEEKEYLRGFVKKVLRKINTAVLVKKILLCTSVGLAAAAVTEGIACIVPFYHAHIFAALFILISFITGIVLGIIARKKETDAALVIDSFGLKERVVTALERIDESDEISQLQRKDAAAVLRSMEENIKVKTGPWLNRILVFTFLLLLTEYIQGGVSESFSRK